VVAWIAVWNSESAAANSANSETNFLSAKAAERKRGQIEFLDEDVDHPNGIVLADPVFQAFRKQRALTAIYALNEAPHPISPANRARIIPRE
jgi:hypothetical protein